MPDTTAPTPLSIAPVPLLKLGVNVIVPPAVIIVGEAFKPLATGAGGGGGADIVTVVLEVVVTPPDVTLTLYTVVVVGVKEYV